MTVSEETHPPLVVIVGPTAVGKTGLAVRLNSHLPVEVVSADSRQVYREMDIGTAKATPEEQSKVPHHLIDVIDPDAPFSLADFQELAYQAIDDIMARDKAPLLVGGTGQYVRAVVQGWRIPRVPPDEALRGRLYTAADMMGAERFHQRLTRVDPKAAAKIDYRNVRRVVRALEVYIKTGRPISEQQGKIPPPYRILMIGLTMPRPRLYERVDRRVDQMIAAGLVNEVRNLLQMGYAPDLPSMSGLGYSEISAYLQDEMNLQDAVQAIKSNTRKFIRHQYNWFSPNSDRIKWFDRTTDPFERILALIRDFVKSS
jgi:tRNA dimethylallyltransferase